MNKIFIIIVNLLLGQVLYSNSAQPGLWSAGGTGTFSLLYPEDEYGYKKIQMIDELVTIKLFDGFASVKGTYWMANTTSDTIKIKTGYPVNSQFKSEKGFYRTDITFDKLYEINVLTNGGNQKLKIEQIPQENIKLENPDWYVWNNAFSPNDTTIIQIYFLVKTNESTLIDGYKHEDLNGFIYLLESGSTWKQPIKKGKIQIVLDGSIKIKKLRGVNPDSIFMWNKEQNMLITNFTNLNPTELDNIIITYPNYNSNFDFAKVVLGSKKYFKELDSIEKLDINESLFEKIEFGNPFKSKKIGINPYLLIYIVPLILLVTGLILIILLVKILIRKIKKRKVFNLG